MVCAADNLSRSSLALYRCPPTATTAQPKPRHCGIARAPFFRHSPSVETAKALSSAAATPARALKTGTSIFAVIAMPPIATASAPSSLLPLRIARQGIREGQGWGERSLCSSQPRRAMRVATIFARASMNITCCANQTQTAQRKSYSGPTSPPSGSVKEKVKPRLDDGGVGFPPFRFGGGGGGGGGGGSSSSGGFILFVIVLLLDYLREFERNLQNGSRRGNDYDNGLAPQ